MNKPADDDDAKVWKGPLEGLKVIDLSRVLSGPFATQSLADLGAEVIKIEALEFGDETRQFPPLKDGISHYFLSVNRNKKSIAINLKHEKGVELLKKLVEDADILVENFRPGVMERLGLGYETLRAINKKLIYCAITGFGLTGPMKDRPSFDIVVQALSGALSVNGESKDSPTKLGIPLGDLVGGIYGPIAILSALHERNRTGEGKLIDISLLDGMINLLGYYSQLAFFSNTNPQPSGSSHPNIVPYGIFDAKDGKIVIACLTSVFWEKLCKSLGIKSALLDERFKTMAGRKEHRDEIAQLITAKTKLMTLEELQALFTAAEVPHSPVLGVLEALSQPQVIAREMVTSVEHPVLGDTPILGRPIKFVSQLQEKLKSPPMLGEHTDEILQSLGLSDAEIENLRAQNILG